MIRLMDLVHRCGCLDLVRSCPELAIRTWVGWRKWEEGNTGKLLKRWILFIHHRMATGMIGQRHRCVGCEKTAPQGAPHQRTAPFTMTSCLKLPTPDPALAFAASRRVASTAERERLPPPGGKPPGSSTVSGRTTLTTVSVRGRRAGQTGAVGNGAAVSFPENPRSNTARPICGSVS